jgi:hypothetical protein
MSLTTESSSLTPVLSSAAAPAPRPLPEVDPFREGRETIEQITADARVGPGEYLDTTLVPGGGE